jgi:hypothetical protein
MQKVNKADVLRSTYGANGKPIMFCGHDGGNASIDDGAIALSVLQNQDFDNPATKMAYCRLKEMTDRVVKEVGDGTTTTILLTAALLRHFSDNRQNRVEVEDFLTDMYRIIKLAHQAEMKLELVARTSTGDYELATKVALATEQAGKGGRVNLRTKLEPGIDVVVEEGFTFGDAGTYPEILMGGVKRLLVTGGYTCIVRDGLDQATQIESILQAWYRTVLLRDKILRNDAAKGLVAIKKIPPLVVFSQMGMSAEALNIVSQNVLEYSRSQGQSGVPIYVVKMPSWFRNEHIEDMEKVFGVRPLGNGQGTTALQYAASENFNKIGQVDITTIGCSIELLNHNLKNRDERLPFVDGDYKEERLTRLTRGRVDLVVASESGAEVNRLFTKAEDALFACQSAWMHGVVNGGGYIWYLLENDPEIGETYGLVGTEMLASLYGEHIEKAREAFKDNKQYDLLSFENVELGHVQEPIRIFLSAVPAAAWEAFYINEAEHFYAHA